MYVSAFVLLFPRLAYTRLLLTHHMRSPELQCWIWHSGINLNQVGSCRQPGDHQ